MMIKTIRSLPKSLLTKNIIRASSSKIPTLSSEEASSIWTGIYKGFEHKAATGIFHTTTRFMLAAVPFNIAFGPSIVTMPIDIVLGVVIPVHAHIGMNAMASDYIPTHLPSSIGGPALEASRAIILATTVVLILGLGDLNINGGGITGVLKALWTAPPSNEHNEH